MASLNTMTRDLIACQQKVRELEAENAQLKIDLKAAVDAVLSMSRARSTTDNG